MRRKKAGRRPGQEFNRPKNTKPLTKKIMYEVVENNGRCNFALSGVKTHIEGVLCSAGKPDFSVYVNVTFFMDEIAQHIL